MRLLILLLLGLAGVLPGKAQNEESNWLLENLESSYAIDLYGSYNVSEGYWQSTALVFRPLYDLTLPGGASLRALFRATSDGFDRLEPGFHAQASISQMSERLQLDEKTDLELREFYLIFYAGPVDITIGKQQIVWGKADGLKILDVVNPQNFNEFVLEEFDDSRIPLWSVMAEFNAAGTDVQLIWLPDPTANLLPEQGAEYEVTAASLVPSPPARIEVSFAPLELPDRFINDGDAGLRLSWFIGGWDISLNYLYHYHDMPVFDRRISRVQELTNVTVRPTLKRSHLLGGTFSNAFGDFTLRGELGYESSRNFSVDDLRDEDGLVESGELASVIGLDWFGLSDSLVSMQVFLNTATDYTETMLREETDSTASLLYQRELMGDFAQLELLWLHSLNNGDGLLSLSGWYDHSDSLRYWLEADILYGNTQTLFGQFAHTDRIRAGITINY